MPRKQAYVVTVGSEIGVFTRWLDVRARTDGISGSRQEGFTDWEEAQEYFDEALARGETRVVHPAPKRERPERKQNVAEMPKVKEPRQRPTQQQQSARTEQKPWARRGTSAGSGDRWNHYNGRAKRDAEIAASVEEVKREQRSASARERRTEPLQHAAPGHGEVPSAARAITAPPRLTSASSHPASASASAANAVSRQRSIAPASRASVPPAREPEPTKTPSASFSTSSSPPTAVTQTKNVFSSDGGGSPRYAQSLSYASSPGDSSVGLRTPSLASSDWRSHLSEPSSLGTQYFPEDWLARQKQARRQERSSLQAAARSPEMASSPLARSPPTVFEDRPQSPSESEYATAPNTPEVQSVDLPEEHSPSLRRRPSAEAMPPPPVPPPRTERTTPSMAESHSTMAPSKRRARNLVGRSLSDAQVQTEREPQFRRRKRDDVAVQAAPSKKHYTDGQVQTSRASSTRTSPLRATSSESNVFGHSPASTYGPVCMCVQPKYVCRCCGGKQRIQSTGSHSPAFSSTSVTPVPPPPSSSSSERQTLRSPIGGHTPLMGPSETQVFMRPITNSIQATMDAMKFSEPARGASAVVHDMRFDPRSPIQRGTAIPAGTSGSVTRPSPAMLPLNSLLFG
ncbi:hypothetical protein L226DRAFT_560369 [Lentinus tigrinus ALCF2SS1-7]|uniref:uncharacterized protein n=1 Tax=Lentinus tigrinus ALCF2SS1-7 TaxID=1328758 RepID=UPI001165F39E|nr:hypothetical protein L226DRAFT_560369 [Lentinus tigrinus ALCF2SS1-7]